MKIRILLSLIVLLSGVSASAVEPLAASVLLRQCGIYARDTVANEAVSCRSYLHGFIGGAFASKTAIQVDEKKKESYTDRAARTRLGRDRFQYSMNRGAGYCIPAAATLDELIAGLNGYAAGMEKVPEQANQLMLRFLKERYPCIDS